MKQIIILRITPNGTNRLLSYVAWYPVAVGREVPLPGKGSAYTEATASEIEALQNGTVIEEVYRVDIPGGATAAQVKSVLETRYTARAAELAALPNPNQFYGVFWDGTIWSA